MYALTAYDAVGFVGDGYTVYEKIVLDGISHVTACGVIISVDTFFRDFPFTGDFIGFPVVDDITSGQVNEYLGNIGPREAYLAQVAQFTEFSSFQYPVDFLACYKQSLFSVSGVHCQ